MTQSTIFFEKLDKYKHGKENFCLVIKRLIDKQTLDLLSKECEITYHFLLKL
jgi:predicted CopG family antitoxin